MIVRKVSNKEDDKKLNETELVVMTWGLIPSFTKQGDKLDFFRMFNSRSETVWRKLSSCTSKSRSDSDETGISATRITPKILRHG